MTAADSPVKIASLMTHDPFMIIKSQGAILSSSTINISPGTRYLLELNISF